jgi:hypothetical protein
MTLRPAQTWGLHPHTELGQHVSKLCCISACVALNIITIQEGGPMADDSLIREALAEAERPKQRRGKPRLVRWNDLERELAHRALTSLEGDTESHE